MQRKDDAGKEEGVPRGGEGSHVVREEEQAQQQQLDPFGLPIGGDAGDGAKEELDLDDLEPRMRSVGVASRPQPGLVSAGGMGMGGALPSYHDRHRGAYLYRESPKMSEPAATFPAPGKVSKPRMPVPVLVRPDTTTTAKAPGSEAEGEGEGQLAAPELPFDTALFPLERCHYYTNKTGPELFEGIEAALQETGVSFQFVPSKFKFMCEYLAGGASLVKFVCRAYFVPEDGRTVVEFQRRAGCCIACAKVVEAVRNTLLVREGNASAAPIPIKPFKARPLSLPECAAHSPSSSEAAEAAEAALRAQQQEQQCKIMQDLQACLAEGKDDVLDGFAKVLVPLSQLSPEHLLSDLAYADLLAQLAARASAGGARLSALSCLANLAATCFGAGPSAGPVAGGVRRDVSSDDEDAAEAAAATARVQLASAAGGAEAWFGRCLGAAVAVVAAPQGQADPHVRREAARALMHAAHAAVGADLLQGSSEGMAALRGLAEAPADRLLQNYAKETLRALGPVA